MKFSYFPGCSLKGTNQIYEESLFAIFKVLGIELEEIDDWNCCGATAYSSVDELKALTLAARNLAIAEKKPYDIFAPCSGCFLVLEKSRRYIQDYPEIQRKVTKALGSIGLTFSGKVKEIGGLD